jgi:phage gpG-like protein
MYLRFAIEGEVQLSRKLLTISDAVKDWSPAFQKSGEDLIEFFSYDVFETEGNAIDERWMPLSQPYAKRKAKRYPNAGILEATGTMRKSFMQAADATSLTIWNAAEYFKYHQSKQPRSSSLPRRVVMKLTENLRQLVVKNFQAYFLERVGGSL